MMDIDIRPEDLELLALNNRMSQHSLKEELDGLLQALTSRDDIPPKVQREFSGFCDRVSMFSNFDENSVRMILHLFNGFVSRNKALMAKGRGEEFNSLIYGVKARLITMLYAAKNGFLLKSINTQYHEQSFSQKAEPQPQTRKVGLL